MTGLPAGRQRPAIASSQGSVIWKADFTTRHVRLLTGPDTSPSELGQNAVPEMDTVFPRLCSTSVRVICRDRNRSIP